MNLEIERLKLRLIETQMALLQYQHREVKANIDMLLAQQEKPSVSGTGDVPFASTAQDNLS